MATLSKHGKSIGRIAYVGYSKEYFTNGDVLKNQGFGWKLAGTIKEGLDPREVYQKQLDKLNLKIKSMPAYAAWRSLILDVGLGKRWKILNAIELMPDDPDGVWSEACDGFGDNVDLSIEEVVDLCKAYKAALAEATPQKEGEA